MLTQVDFHSGVADRVRFACRLLHKAYQRQATLAVRAPASTLTALDRALWMFEHESFVPHLLLRAGTDPAALARTPIWLLDGPVPASGPPILVCIDAGVLVADRGFERVIEIVGTDADAVQAGRRRWREYEQRGWPLRHHRAGAASAEAG